MQVVLGLLMPLWVSIMRPGDVEMFAGVDAPAQELFENLRHTRCCVSYAELCEHLPPTSPLPSAMPRLELPLIMCFG